MFDLSGKVAIVTGSARGIGKGIAECFAEAGANIVVCDILPYEETCLKVEKLGTKALGMKSDVSNPDDVRDLVARTVKEFRRLDIIANVAGIPGAEKPVTGLTEEDWDKVMNLNLRGVFLCSREAAKQMLTQREGKIINIASMAGLIAIKNIGPYCVSKAGVIQLTKVMALELARYNIQVNAIAPGYTETPMTQEFFSTEAGKEVIRRNIPMRRLANVDELKGAALYLASPASSFTTGSCLVVDGGHTIW
jgi:NAD(P)-dependent dehydrogenase (short-subunit alcohol dehydrogenase family)